MKLAICNEVLSDLDFEQQCEYAASLGYQGIELAPFTLGDQPHLLPRGERRRLHGAARGAGLEIVGLHWLLLVPAGLSITSPDDGLRQRTSRVIEALIDLCADLEGRIMVHGSPAQRQVEAHDDPAAARERARAVFEKVASRAERSGVTYCLEPLPAPETNFINTLEEAAEMVRAIDSPAFKTMLDTRAASLAENRPVEQLAREWFPTGLLGHVHLNDRNRRGPGQGSDRFAPLLNYLEEIDYQGYLSVEPFEYAPDGRAVAAHSIGYLRGILES